MADGDMQKMLRAIISGQSSLRADMTKGFDKVNERIDTMETKLDKRIDDMDKKLTKRIDKIGGQLAYLEDDAPTREEFDKLEIRVTTLETASV